MDEGFSGWVAAGSAGGSPGYPSVADTLWDGDGPMPERTVRGGAVVPDLTRIESSRWAEVLAVLPERIRIEATLGPGFAGRGVSAFDLALALPPAPSDRARAALGHGMHVPTPEARSPRRSGRQVGVRVTVDEYRMLEVAAHLLGAKPTQIARMLILNGVRRVLAEHDAAIGEAGRGA